MLADAQQTHIQLGHASDASTSPESATDESAVVEESATDESPAAASLPPPLLLPVAPLLLPVPPLLLAVPPLLLAVPPLLLAVPPLLLLGAEASSLVAGVLLEHPAAANDAPMPMMTTT